jgi:glycine betaine/proline transport system substrate-binding protein
MQRMFMRGNPVRKHVRQWRVSSPRGTFVPRPFAARRYRWQAVLLLVVVLTFSPAYAQDVPERPGEGVRVEPGVTTSVSGKPFDAIFRVLLEELGYEVAPAVELANPLFYQAVTQGDLDYWPNGWFPLQSTQLPRNFDEHASILDPVIAAGALQGYLVDKRSAEAYGITSLEDFKRPEVKEAFDGNGDGKADLLACPPGWGCELVIEHHLDAYGLREHVNDHKGAYEAGFADVLARYRNGESVLFYTWTPNFTILRLVPGEDVVWINVPEIDPSDAQEGHEDVMEIFGVEGAVTDPILMGFVANDISPVANDRFLAENPAAHRLFDLIEIDMEEISVMAQRTDEGENSDEALRAMAMEWVAEHQGEVEAWLEEARRAAR